MSWGAPLAANLFGLGLILWVGLFFWTFNLMGSAPAQLILAALVTLWAPRLAIQWVQGFFAGRPWGKCRLLDQDVAKILPSLPETFPGVPRPAFFGLESASLLNYPEASRLFVGHFFRMGHPWSGLLG